MPGLVRGSAVLRQHLDHLLDAGVLNGGMKSRRALSVVSVFS
jgi:hypothetical protein